MFTWRCVGKRRLSGSFPAYVSSLLARGWCKLSMSRKLNVKALVARKLEHA
jgi:hypothetical protein